MGKTREIKGRIRAVSNIQRITKTMQMIATSRFQKAQKRVVSARPYTQKIAELVGELAAAQQGSDLSHPLLRQSDLTKSDSKQLLLVLTSNRGLCGAYNANVIREAVGFLKARGDRPTVIEMVGKKGNNAFKYAGYPVAKFHNEMPDTPTYDASEVIAQRYMDEFVNGDYDQVNICYMAFHSMGRQAPRILPLLPLQKPQVADEAEAGKAKAEVDYDFSPEPEELLNQLLPMTVKTQLYQCFNEAALSEHIYRMVAMKAATDAAGKMRKSLTRQFNRARQAAITTELTEIISGAAVLG